MSQDYVVIHAFHSLLPGEGVAAITSVSSCHGLSVHSSQSFGTLCYIMGYINSWFQEQGDPPRSSRKQSALSLTGPNFHVVPNQ